MNVPKTRFYQHFRLDTFLLLLLAFLSGNPKLLRGPFVYAKHHVHSQRKIGVMIAPW